MKLSEKALGIKPSSTLSITEKAGVLRGEGKDVISFSVGEPDFDTPDHIKKAAIDAINEGFTKYTPAAGTVELRKAVAKKLKEDNGLDYDYTQIVISNGAKHSLVNALMAIVNPGDEVIIPAPFWLSYAEMVRIAGGTPVIAYTKAENNFELSREILESAYTDKTKAVIVTTPSNPTGMVLTEKCLREIADFAVEKDIIVIADEIYEKLIYSKDKKHISIASFGKEIYERTITVNGVSKSYAMTGWRIGYTASSKQIAKLMASMQSHMTSNPNSIAQMAALAAIEGPQDCVEDMREKFEERRDYIYDRVAKMPYLKTLKPEGAFYLFVDFSGTYGKKYNDTVLESAAQIGALLLDEELIAVVPCADFGMPDYIRFSYATSNENIKKGMDRLEDFISKLK
ncbi:pyridoxal phosphate-dependent aminotransferase [Anaerotignum sp. MSJ-24]|uniref:pyridoxal phosphate-dependent aminotransferase n=1 Tax=Anaerotignum sp. MSJ-24 TaxID=2841521 RepID=UPI001C11065F|nr:pyridoxal phosphate-dependent aminotransferase [Anaerotignum sp. MSJ-24]MBU5464418.1 pyridoxal phosphate-dependent aminotransferase [Anaerotignum sp. MSJ-24]